VARWQNNHFGVCDHAVRSPWAVHGDSVDPGDVFCEKDPTKGAAWQSRMWVPSPVLVGRQLVGWPSTRPHDGLWIGRFFGWHSGPGSRGKK